MSSRVAAPESQAAGAAAACKRPRISVSLGPGQHAAQLLSCLGRHGLLDRVIRSWPSLTCEQWNDAEQALQPLWSVPAYAVLVRLVWATWRRIPRAGRYPTPRTFLYSVFDRIAARNLGSADVFLGWSQQSLHCLRAAKRAGALTALEHPMIHALAWQETMEEEYARFAPDSREFYSLLPASLVRRLLAEYEAADFIVVPSSVAHRSFTDHGVAGERVLVTPLAVETSQFASVAPRDPADRFRVLYVGRLELLKGVHYLLEGWRQLGLPGAELVLAGPVLPELEGVLARLGDASLKVLGPVPHERVPQLIEACDVLVFPSICDAFGLVVLEAMAAARPVIATSRSAGPDVIAEGEGFVVPPRDARALRDRLEWLYLHPAERLEMGRRAQVKARSKYGLDSYASELLRVYSEIFTAHQRPVGSARPAVAGA